MILALAVRRIDTGFELLTGGDDGAARLYAVHLEADGDD
jgi:hypothetical protein